MANNSVSLQRDLQQVREPHEMSSGSKTGISSAPSSKSVISKNIVTHDILLAFSKAATKIPPGQLVKDELFSLFDAVGALEIGDPKMDSGSLEFGESLDEDYPISKGLLPDELIWLMDQLMARQVAWLMGYPLSQTVFTSVYVDRLLWPDPSQLSEAEFIRPKYEEGRFDHEVLRGFCLALIKSCDLVLSMVTSQHYYEEEDFTTQLFNRQLLSRFSVSDVLHDTLKSVEKIDILTGDVYLQDALRARLSFQTTVLNILNGHVTFRKPTKLELQDIYNAMNRIKSTSHVGRSISGAFNTKIQRKLASTVPPRPMVVIDLEKIWPFWQQLLQDSTNVFETCSASNSVDFLTAFSLFGAQSPSLSTYPRALLQSILSEGDLVSNRLSIDRFMQEDLQSLSFAGSSIMNPTMNSRADTNMKQAQEELANFITKVAPTFINVYRRFCLNRCRTRRTLCHVVVEWDQIQAEAEVQDERLHSLTKEQPSGYPTSGQSTFSYSLSSWVYHHKLIQLRDLVSLGFELSVYAPHELSQMYWYLAHICDAHMSHLERISHFIVQRENSFGKNPRIAKEKITECKAGLNRLLRHFAWLKATHASAIALHGLYLVLQRQGYLKGPTTTYSLNELRHEIRMRPFQGMSIPEPLSYDELSEGSFQRNVDTRKILSDSMLSSGLAKSAWEEVLKSGWHEYSLLTPKDIDLSSEGSITPAIDAAWSKDVRGALSSSIATRLALVGLQSRISDDSGKEHKPISVELPISGDSDFRHPWWIVPRVKIL